MKNVFMILFSVLLLATAQNINAQEVDYDAINENVNFLQFYDNEMFHWSYNIFGGLTLNYGNDNWQYRAFGIDINNEIIRNALLGYPDSAQAFNSFKKNAITGNVVYWSGIALMIGSLIPVFIVDDQRLSNGLYTGMLAGGLTTSIVGVFQFSSAQSNLFEAVNLFNRNKARSVNR